MILSRPVYARMTRRTERHASVPELQKRNHLDGGDAVDDHLAEHVLELAGGAEGGALVDLRLERRVDLVVGVTADGGTPGADVVDVLVAVDVEA